MKILPWLRITREEEKWKHFTLTRRWWTTERIFFYVKNISQFFAIKSQAFLLQMFFLLCSFRGFVLRASHSISSHRVVIIWKCKDERWNVGDDWKTFQLEDFLIFFLELTPAAIISDKFHSKMRKENFHTNQRQHMFLSH